MVQMHPYYYTTAHTVSQGKSPHFPQAKSGNGGYSRAVCFSRNVRSGSPRRTTSPHTGRRAAKTLRVFLRAACGCTRFFRSFGVKKGGAPPCAEGQRQIGGSAAVNMNTIEVRKKLRYPRKKSVELVHRLVDLALNHKLGSARGV